MDKQHANVSRWIIFHRWLNKHDMDPLAFYLILFSLVYLCIYGSTHH